MNDEATSDSEEEDDGEHDGEYDVYAIIDRKEESNSKYSYLVLWVGQRQESTWEPREALVRQGLGGEVQLVDDYKLSEEPSFEAYCRKMGIEIGASAHGRCMFLAVALATARLKNRRWFTEAVMAGFYDARRIANRPVSHPGFNYPILLSFIKYGNDSAAARSAIAISVHTLDKNLLSNSVRSFNKLNTLYLDDGIYLCAFKLAPRRAHCFILVIHNGINIAEDGEPIPKPLLEFVQDWNLLSVIFLRQLGLHHV
jgi:hypothetical protein